MAITSDWHLHTKCSCDSACMEFETLVSDAKRLGITDFGVTDHYHTRINEGEIAASRKEFDATLIRHPELKGHFHFGIEATVISQWEVDKIARGEYDEPPVYGFREGGPAGTPVIFDFDEEFMEKYGIEYVVAGMHWPMYCATDAESVLKEYHRQYMFAATHPYTTIMAHYLWFDRTLARFGYVNHPYPKFSSVPQSMKSELKAAMLENNVAFELNCGLIVSDILEGLSDDYLDWAAELQSSGITLAIGSDCHSPHLDTKCDYSRIDNLLKTHGIDTSKLFCL